LRAGVHYPRSFGEFQSWFGRDEDCLDYLEWLRWPDGFVCSACGASGWRLGDGRFMCAGCGFRSSVTAGTLFDRSRTPLTVWFYACWTFAISKDGVSASSLQRQLGFGSYQTAWALLQRLRAVLVRPGRERLSGRVEVDETYLGGPTPGLTGRALGKRALLAIAVEVREDEGIGRCRLAPIQDVSSRSLGAFVQENVDPGTVVVTDGWPGYAGIAGLGYGHEQRNQSAAKRAGEDPHALLPAVHRVASLVKRWLLGTHQGAVGAEHLEGYLNEFVFRFNRRSSRSRGMLFYRLLELAIAHEPVRYREMVKQRRPRSTPPTPPGTRGKPSSIARGRVDHPWRKRADPYSS
jgi:hypothetical protein